MLGTLIGYVEEYGSSLQKDAARKLKNRIFALKCKGKEDVGGISWDDMRQELYEICGDVLWNEASNFGGFILRLS